MRPCKARGARAHGVRQEAQDACGARQEAQGCTVGLSHPFGRTDVLIGALPINKMLNLRLVCYT
jgi:hypothetical protein